MHIQLLFTRIPESFSAGLLSRSSSPGLHTYLGFPQPMYSTFHSAFLNVIKFSCACFVSLSRPLWMVSLPSVLSTAPLSLVLTPKFLRVHSTDKVTEKDKKKNTGPDMVPSGRLLVTCLYLDLKPLTTGYKPPTNSLLTE